MSYLEYRVCGRALNVQEETLKPFHLSHSPLPPPTPTAISSDAFRGFRKKDLLLLPLGPKYLHT